METLRVYIGTYAEAMEEGIVCAAFDPQSGRLTRMGDGNDDGGAAKGAGGGFGGVSGVSGVSSISGISGISGIANPSYLAASPGAGKLYAVSESDASVLVVLDVVPHTGSLKQVQQEATRGEAACFVSLDADGRYALVANYFGGNVVMFELDAAGRLVRLCDEVRHEGSGPVRERQATPHPHSIVPDVYGRFAAVPDLGTDQVVLYRIDAATSRLVRHAIVDLPGGAGPRHFVFHPTRPFAYVINELNSTFTAFAYDGEAGCLRELQTVSTLPGGFDGISTCAHLQISPDGNYIYGSNRGHDSLVVCRITEEGTLEVVQIIASGGLTPRNFALSPDGAFLLAANQDSDRVVVFAVDAATGRLRHTGQELAVARPVCVIFYME